MSLGHYVWLGMKVGAILLVGAGAIFFFNEIINSVQTSAAPAASESFYMQGQVISAHNYSSGGGFLSGSSQHDIVILKVSDGTIFSENFSCSYYNAGMNVSIVKTIQYPNVYDQYPPFSAGGNAMATTGTTDIKSIYTDYLGNLTTSYTHVTFRSEKISYAVSGAPEGC